MDKWLNETDQQRYEQRLKEQKYLGTIVEEDYSAKQPIENGFKKTPLLVILITLLVLSLGLAIRRTGWW